MSEEGPNPLTRFSATVADYRRYRPSYPQALLDWTEGQLGREPALVLDLACGTGILSAAAVERGWSVVGLDPNADMLAVARAEVDGARWVRARSEATGLAAGSVDLVLCGQAFHWFDVDAALTELERVLTPDGKACACWNLRGRERGIGADYHALLCAWSSEYAAHNADPDFIEDLRATLAPRGLEQWRGANDQLLDLECLLGRARSASYVAHGVADLPGFEAALTALFERHAEGGRVRFPYDTVGLAWR